MSAVKPAEPAPAPTLLDEKRALDTPLDTALDEKPVVRVTPSWELERDAAVLKAVEAHDEEELRHLSSQPGGFGSRSARRAAW